MSEDDPRPPYMQVADHLRAQITAGKLRSGQRLPAQKQLAKEYGVAPMTVGNAIRELRDRGLLVSSYGRGVFVTADAAHVEEPPADSATGDSAELGELRSEVEALRRQCGRLEALILDLYSRTGQPFPHESAEQPSSSVRAAGA